MKYLFILLLIFLIIPISVFALDRPLIRINDCYNLTVTYDLTDGNKTPVGFLGCSHKFNETWFCNCREDDGTYMLTMQTDGTMIRNAREYDIDVKANRIHYYPDSVSFEVKDWGDYTDLEGKHLKDMEEDNFEGDKCDTRTITQFVYINRTVEVPLYKTQYVDKPVYIERNITQYIDVVKEVNVTIERNVTKVCKLNFWETITKNKKCE